VSTATSKVIPTGSDVASRSPGPSSLELWGPFAHVPPLEEIERLTEVPDRRVVFRGVDWAFYDRLVESIPEGRNIHVDYDGKDIEVTVAISRRHERTRRVLRQLVETIAQEMRVPYSSAGGTTWKRPEIARGLEADESYYFLPEKIAADGAALKRGSDDIADYPNPDLTIEVDLTPPQVDRAGIHSALKVAEIWRFDGRTVVIERLAADGTYLAAPASGFLPIGLEELRRWVIEGNDGGEFDWVMRLRNEFRTRAKE
jgi:Uma2 family endonuclease